MAREAAAESLERIENEPPRVDRLVLNPRAPLPGQRVEAHVEASDPDGDPIRLELEWRLAGRTVEQGSRTAIVLEGARKGDEVAVFVTATDGRDLSDPVRGSVNVGNTAPLIRAFYLAPDGEIAPGQEVTAAPQAMDADGDALDYEFEWILNGRKVRGEDQAVFNTERLKRGDRLQARVRVSDGDEWSPVAESMTLTLANDPDGDRSLRFRLLEGPAGMTVDSVTGRLSWRPGPDEVGTHAVEVAVADAEGAESAMRFELNVSGGAASEPAPAKRDDADDLE
jgi:hypothetical protein